MKCHPGSIKLEPPFILRNHTDIFTFFDANTQLLWNKIITMTKSCGAITHRRLNKHMAAQINTTSNSLPRPGCRLSLSQNSPEQKQNSKTNKYVPLSRGAHVFLSFLPMALSHTHKHISTCHGQYTGGSEEPTNLRTEPRQVEEKRCPLMATEKNWLLALGSRSSLRDVDASRRSGIDLSHRGRSPQSRE